MVQRIQKILAAAGFGSRRACEELVEDGRVAIDGKIITSLPILLDPAKSRVTVDGKPVRAEKYVYFLLNKPKGYYCTNNDPEGRRRVVDLMTGVRERVYPVGRLDADSMGLLLMTNDGDLSQKLTHPRYGAPKTYRVEVRGKPTAEQIASLKKGIWIAEGKTKPAEVELIHSGREKTVLEITLREGRNREIRRMLASSGHKVRRLTRIKIGRLSVKHVPLGGFRPLTDAEVKYLFAMTEKTELEAAEAKKKSKTRRRTKTAAGGSSRNRTSVGGGLSSSKTTSQGKHGEKKQTKSESKRPVTEKRQQDRQPKERDSAVPATKRGNKRRIIMPND